ncbi:MAG: TlpA family protein disulfide reductase [Planctomycetes bacterium]|nr:TlpA family protein disulfide reductase [Planctomycetota bacterium]
MLLTFASAVCCSALGFAAPPAKASPTAIQHSVLKVALPANPTIPPVWLSTAHSKLCKVVVGEAFPAIKLPLLGGETTDLATLRGADATVILFWHPDRWMARTALVDLERDVVKKYAADRVAVIGIAVHQPSGAAQEIINRSHATYPQLLDTAGEALSKVGTYALPRLYVLDAAGRVVWFDIEYSEGTRRELEQTLGVLIKAKH